jgi:hypothetical protein
VATIPLASSTSFPVGVTTLPAGNPWTVPAGVNGVDGSVSAGPMADPATTFDGEIQLDRLDGNGFVAVGGISANGGLSPTVKGGPGTTPVSVTSHVFIGLKQGWQMRLVVTVTGPAAVTASASLTTF